MIGRQPPITDYVACDSLQLPNQKLRKPFPSSTNELELTRRHTTITGAKTRKLSYNNNSRYNTQRLSPRKNVVYQETLPPLHHTHSQKHIIGSASGGAKLDYRIDRSWKPQQLCTTATKNANSAAQRKKKKKRSFRTHPCQNYRIPPTVQRTLDNDTTRPRDRISDAPCDN